MNLLYPLGLLGLIGIPILIIIYIIKNKYTEQVISSTYIWTLSEKFLKKRNPINKIVGIISLILQILAVLFISVAVAHPVFVVPNAANEYLFVLDGSGSMNITNGRKTRLDIAKDEISSVINSSLGGSSYTLVYVGDTTSVLYDRTENRELALKVLGDITPAFLDTGYADALGEAQNYFDEKSNSVKTYLVTDKSVQTHHNVTVIDVSSREENYALCGVSYSFVSEGNVRKLQVTGSALSYESNATLNVGLYIDGAAQAAASCEIDAVKLEKGEFTLTAECSSFDNIRVAITNKDALDVDNEVIIYSPGGENVYKALIVSGGNPFYVHAALDALPNVEVEAIEADSYGAGITGYDLYVFDAVSDMTLPRDGAVWLFNPGSGLSGCGFTVQGTTELMEGSTVKYSTLEDSAVTVMKEDLKFDDIYVKEYVKCWFNRKFSTLMTHDDNPLVFAGTNEYGNREIVTAFDLGKSNLAMTPDFFTLIRNFLNYTFPRVFKDSVCTAGDNLILNIAAGCDSVRVESPLGNVTYLNTGSDTAEMSFNEVGLYRAVLTYGGQERVFNIFAVLPESEGAPVAAEESFSIVGVPGNSMKSGSYDKLWMWFILIAALLAADWMVYCYEQYQLR